MKKKYVKLGRHMKALIRFCAKDRSSWHKLRSDYYIRRIAVRLEKRGIIEIDRLNRWDWKVRLMNGDNSE